MTRTVLLALGVAGLLGCSDPSPAWRLVWEDEFEGPAGQLPSTANWRFDVGTDWGNAQLEYDTNRAENASLDGAGNLAIVARQESFQGSNYTSARITTRGLREYREGRFEARIRIPTSSGVWPAFWLLGANTETVGWPRSGEIDIMESFGRNPNAIAGSLHGPGYSGGNALTRQFELADRFDADFHVFAVEWTVDQIEWFVDGTVFQSIQARNVPGDWVFDHPFYLILNLAIGGGPPGPPSGSTVFPQTMLVDWVRVYEQQ